MDWMANYCQKTCEFCISDCRDKHGFQCKKKAKTEDCNDKEMMKKCPKACGLCWLCWTMILQIETNSMKFRYLTKFWLKWINVYDR